ncbi:MAG: MarR family transcriptional regulator [Alistipes sp.]|nr:MarR family transcriptional regulator [Alistipes sp.]
MDSLKLENQLCFPLYACAKEVVRRYRPLLEPLGLTYTLYIAMMVMWEHRTITMSQMGQLLYLDSGTLTPMLKKMEQQGWIRRERSCEDERNIIIHLTSEGERLRSMVSDVPKQMSECVELDIEQMQELYRLLQELLQRFYNK